MIKTNLSVFTDYSLPSWISPSWMDRLR